MTSYVLDTNTIVRVVREDSNSLQNFQRVFIPTNRIYGCPMVWYEARRGLLFKDAHARMNKFAELFQLLYWDEFGFADWKLATDLWSHRQKLGKPIGDADLMIAVYAMNRNATLVTDNEKDFVDLGVNIENWK
jgi:tRNA(fMet)-specific endonuclease VapC